MMCLGDGPIKLSGKNNNQSRAKAHHAKTVKQAEIGKWLKTKAPLSMNPPF